VSAGVPELSVIVPAFNEQAHIADFLGQLDQALQQITEDSYEILVVDDGSRDATWSVLGSLQGPLPNLRAFRLSRNFGKDAALCAGIQEARGRLCLIMDGDFEHPISVIPAMLEAQRKSGANVVDALKTRAHNEPWFSRTSARMFYRLFHWLSGYDLGGHTDFKLFDASVRLAWLELQERNVFFRGIFAWMGFQHETVHFTVPSIEDRRTRWTRVGLLRLALKSITSFSTAPLQVVSFLGLLTFLLTCGLGAIALYHWLTGVAVEGFTTVILLQLLQGSITMGALGVIGLYLARISEEVKARPRYLVSERLERSASESRG
jgi:glycosyltransferase involved in cell wall biosynthesis